MPVLERAPGHLIRVAQQVHWALWDREMHGDLTSVQYAMLLVLASEPGVDQRTLGERLSTDKSTTATVARRLGAAGLLRRLPDGRDRRRKSLELTPEGLRVYQGSASSVLRVQEQLLAPLEPQQRYRLLELLRVVAYGSWASPQIMTVELPGAEPMRLEAAPGHLIRRAQQVHWRLWNNLVGRAITSPQYSVLLVMHEAVQLDQTTLGRRASLDKSTAADVVGRLANRKLLRCSRHYPDGRRNLVSATELGMTLVEDAAPAVHQVQRELFGMLAPAQQRDFLKLMAIVSGV